MNQYLGGKEASAKLGVHQRTLMQWDKKGWINTIRTPGNKRLYDVEKFLKEHNLKSDIKNNINEEQEEKLNICYVRVSTNDRKDDLERQKDVMKELYKDYIIIEDIGSGLNLNKKGIRKIIDLAIKGKINKLVITHKDRLVRFGYELIEDLIKDYSNGEIIVIYQKEIKKTEGDELMYDMLQIMNIYEAKMNGLRKYKKK